MIPRPHSVNAEFICLPGFISGFVLFETRLPTLSRAKTRRAAVGIDDILRDAIKFGNQRIELVST